MDEYKFSTMITASKIPNVELVTELTQKYSNIDFLKLKKYEPKAKYGFAFETKMAKLSDIKNSKVFIDILTDLNNIGAKAHNAKNNYMHITMDLTNIDTKIKKRVSYFLLKNIKLCRAIARKNKKFDFHFNEVNYFDLDKNINLNKMPWKWGENTICFCFFRSTLKFSTILASIEFIKSVFDFFVFNQVLLDDLFENTQEVYKKYMDFIFLNDYSNLHQYLQEQNIDMLNLMELNFDQKQDEPRFVGRFVDGLHAVECECDEILPDEAIPDEIVECDEAEDVLDEIGCEVISNEAAEAF